MVVGSDYDVAMKKVDMSAESILVIQYDQRKIRCEEANNIFQAAKRIVGERKVLMIPDIGVIATWDKRTLTKLRVYIDGLLEATPNKEEGNT